MRTSADLYETTTTCSNILQQSRYQSLALYLPNTEYLFIFLFQLIIVFSIVNNVVSIQTCLRLPIRITNLGVYLIFLCASNLIRCVFLEISVICDVQTLQRTAFFHISAISLNVLNFSSMWLSSMIACERLCIECFNFALYATGQRACLISLIIFLLTLLTQLPTLFVYFDHFSVPTMKPLLSQTVKSIEFVTVLLTCLLHILSSILILTKISLHKVYG